MARTKKLVTNRRPVPQTMEDASAEIYAIGVGQRERARLVTLMNDEIAAIKERYATRVAELDGELRDRTEGVQVFCASRRDSLTNGGRIKTYRFPSGEVAWRLRPPSVSVRGKESIVAACKALGLTRFIRVTEEPNKEAMLAEPEVAAAIDGVSIGSAGEDFIVKPLDTELEEVVR